MGFLADFIQKGGIPMGSFLDNALAIAKEEAEAQGRRFGKSQEHRSFYAVQTLAFCSHPRSHP